MGKENELIVAVKDGNSQHVRKLLHKHRKSSKKGSNKKSSVNIADSEGFAALHHASLLGDVEMAMAIIEMEGDPNIRDKKGMTPLHMACWAGKETTVKALLQNKALPNLPSFNGDTPLHLAAQHGYSGCARILLEFKADGAHRNNDSETPLDLACQYGHTAVVRQLLNNEKVTFLLTSPEPGNQFKSPLHLSAKSGHDDIVHLLLQAGSDVNEERPEGTPLHQAALYGKTDAVRLLIQAGADVHRCNNNGMRPLDLLNKFTTSRAALEVKQMLREAAGEKLVYATAVSDYNNQYDNTCLSFKNGDSIAVIEQNENGRWRGYVINSQNERVGYFPAMAVYVMNPSITDRSISSSSNLSAGTRSSISSSPDKRAESSSSTPQPVGIVNIGNFEVVTLAQNDLEHHKPPKQTASGSLPPRMSSFKQKHSIRHHNQTPPSQPAPPPPIEQPITPNPARRPNIAQRQLSVPTPAKKQLHFSQPPQKVPQRSGPENHPPTTNYGTQTLNRHRSRNEASTDQFRTRASSAGTAHYDLAQALRQGIPNQQRENPESRVNNYPQLVYDTRVSPTQNQTPQNVTNYTTVSFSNNNSNDSENFYVNQQNISQNGKHHQNKSQNDSLINSFSTNRQTYDADLTKPVLTKNRNQSSSNVDNVNPQIDRDSRTNMQGAHVHFARTPDEKRKMNLENGYEFMYNIDNSEVSPPQLPLKRSKTLPVSDARKYMMNQQEANRIKPQIHSVKQRPSQQLYENTHVERGGASPWPPRSPKPYSISGNTPDLTDGGRSPRSPRSPRTPQSPKPYSSSGNTPDSTDGSFGFPSLPRLKYDDHELMDWLTELKLSCYYANFKSHGFDMVSVRAITPEDLNIIEITKTGHRKKLLSEIAKLPPTDKLSNEKPNDVGSWLGQLNLRQYESNFVEGGFDDIDFIRDLDKNDLEMIDIKKKGHQKKLLLAVQRLTEIELTSILDDAVAESPIKRTSIAFTHSYQEEQEFFPDIPLPKEMSAVTAYHPLSPRDDLPPPPGQEQIDQSPKHKVPMIANKPKGQIKKPPVAVPPKPTNKPHVAPPPASKPKPKPAPKENGTLNKGLSSSAGEIQGNQEEVVRSSKSRDFFKQQEQKAQEEDSPTNSIDRRSSYSERRASYADRSSSFSDNPSPPNTMPRKVSTGKSPIPPPVTKPRTNSTNSTDNIQPIAPIQVKKAPPPAPPKRSGSLSEESLVPTTPVDVSISNGLTIPEEQDVEEPTVVSPRMPTFKPEPPPVRIKPETNQVQQPIPSPPPTFSPPPVESTSPVELPPPALDVTSESLPSPPPPSLVPNEFCAAAVTIDSQPSVDPTSSNTNVDVSNTDSFAETDDIMKDLMADIDDFEAQLDAMF